MLLRLNYIQIIVFCNNSIATSGNFNAGRSAQGKNAILDKLMYSPLKFSCKVIIVFKKLPFDRKPFTLMKYQNAKSFRPEKNEL